MGWPSEILQIPQKLVDSIQSNKCTVFIGSGGSPKCYYEWHQLVDHLCIKCGSGLHVNKDSPPDKLINAAQDAKDKGGEQYYEVLHDHFGKPVNDSSLLFESLLSLPFDCYLTVNFDPSLALQARTAKIKCDQEVMAYPSLNPKEMRDRKICHLHGIITEEIRPKQGTIVLAKDEFDEAYADNSNLLNCLVSTLTNDPILFVGCGLREFVIEKVFNICKRNQNQRIKAMSGSGELNSLLPPRYVAVAKPEVLVDGHFNLKQSCKQMKKEGKRYQDMGIEPLWYTASGDDHSALRKALDQQAKLPGISVNYGWKGGPNGN